MLLATICVAQTKSAESIYIGTDLRLGTARDAVIAKLANDYKLVKIKTEGDEWFVADKSKTSTVYGELGFSGGKLTYAARTWTPREATDGFSLAQAIHAALTELAHENKHTCYMDTGSKRTPDDEMKDVWLICGAKKLRITTTEVFSGTGQGTYVDVMEILSSEKNR
jgi:hypothetical protein